MSETAQQYIARLHRTLGDRKPLEVLEATLNHLESKFESSRKSGQSPLPAGKWSDGEILAHFAEGEMVIGYRMRMILSANGCPIQGYDQEKWVAGSGYLQANPAVAMALFSALRRSNLELLKSLSKEQWDYFGMHSERGKESIFDMVKLLAGHDLNHMGQIGAQAKAPA